jgi:hypothetical protein
MKVATANGRPQGKIFRGRKIMLVAAEKQRELSSFRPRSSPLGIYLVFTHIFFVVSYSFALAIDLKLGRDFRHLLIFIEASHSFNELWPDNS